MATVANRRSPRQLPALTIELAAGECLSLSAERQGRSVRLDLGRQAVSLTPQEVEALAQGLLAVVALLPR
jgi:hypothetical protein